MDAALSDGCRLRVVIRPISLTDCEVNVRTLVVKADAPTTAARRGTMPCQVAIFLESGREQSRLGVSGSLLKTDLASRLIQSVTEDVAQVTLFKLDPQRDMRPATFRQI